MDRPDLKQLIQIGLLIVIVLWIGLYGPFGLPSVTSLRADAAKLKLTRTKLERDVQSAQREVANLDKIRKDREALEVQLRELNRRLPGERESAQVLRSVENLAGRSGLTVGQVKRRPVRTQELYAEIPMEVGVGGGYHDLVRFAGQLAELDRLVTLTEFQVTRPSATAATPLVAATPGPVKAQMVTVVFQALPEPRSAAPGTPGAAAAPR